MVSRLSRVAVVVPARNEERRISRCLDGIRHSVDALRSARPELAVSVVVVLHECDDGTADLVRQRDWVTRIELRDGFVGGARQAGAAAVAALGDAPDRVWIANTDADSHVPRDWLLAHVAAAEDGADVVVGMVTLDRSEASPELLEALGPEEPTHDGHHHVFGANLGVRLSALQSLGGFEDLAAHEDVALVEAARAGELTVVAPAQPRVVTSARLRARTPEGLGAYLRELLRPRSPLVAAADGMDVATQVLNGVDRLVVVVAHPDDETLIAGGLIHRAARSGLPTTVVIATRGEASHPDSPTHTPTQLGALRVGEVRAALHHLHRAADLVLLDLPDGALADHREQLVDLVRPHITGAVLVVSTWEADGHPDHEAVGQVCRAVCTEAGVRHLQAPLWAWFWQPERQHGRDLLVIALSPQERAAKAAALHEHASQLQALSEDPGDAAVVGEEVVAAFSQGLEAFVTVGTTRAETFDRMYAGHEDPWRFEGSWYETRKRSLALAALPHQALGRVLEIGPATGLVTVELARRADAVVAMDVSAQAALRTSRRVAGAGLGERVQVIASAVPAHWPEGELDTVVVSEVGYFMTADEWRTTLTQAQRSLAADGTLLLVHWMHPVDGWALDGRAVHDIASNHLDLDRGTTVSDPDFEIVVYRRPGALSVAAAEHRT